LGVGYLGRTTGSQTGTFDNPIRYAGYLYDANAKLYYLQSRYYNPATGRFLTKDTYEGDRTDPLSLNLYIYAHNNPVRYTDPTGHMIHEPSLHALNASSGPIRMSKFGTDQRGQQYATFTDGKSSWTIYDTSAGYENVTKVAQTVYESSRSSSGSGSQASNIAEEVIRQNPDVQAVLYIGSEIYLYRDTLQGQNAKTVARADTNLNVHVQNQMTPLGSAAYASISRSYSATFGSGSYANASNSGSYSKAVYAPTGAGNQYASVSLATIVNSIDPSGNTTDLIRGLLDSIDENVMGEFAEWLIYKLTDSSVSGPWPDTNLESFYFGRMVGDALSMVIGTGKTVVGIVEVIGAIGGGAGISIGSGGTLLGEGITISVAGATAGTALVVAGSAASGRSIVSFGSDMDKYYDARMNAESGGNSGSSGGNIEGAGNSIEFGSDTKSTQKLSNQMTQRGWTERTVRNTVSNPYTTRMSTNKATGNPATVYYNKSGGYVIIDDITKTVVQISDNISPSTWIPDSSIINPYKP
jgi:RHS repeat-associated protein